MTECKTQCGDCCRDIHLPVARDFMITPDVKRWIELHGITIVKIQGKRYYRIPLACHELVGGLCMIYPIRPNTCKNGACTKRILEGAHEL